MGRREPIGPLSLSDAMRHGPALKKAGWSNRDVMTGGVRSVLWFPTGYVDPVLVKLLASTSPFSLSLSDAQRHGPALKKAGWSYRQVKTNGAQSNLWFPSGYVDPELTRLLASTSPFSLSRSDANRHGPALKKAGWSNRTVRTDGVQSPLWFPPQTDGALSTPAENSPLLPTSSLAPNVPLLNRRGTECTNASGRV